MSDVVDFTSKMDPHRSNNASPVQFGAKSEPSSGYASSSTTPNSPQSVSPPHTLKRSKSSSFRLINRRISTISNSSYTSIPPEAPDRLATIIGWYPAFLLKIYFELLVLFTMVFLKHLPLMIPTLWISACLWLVWKTIIFPFSVVRFLLIVMFVPASERQRRKRTVLISGGSTVQSIYLARNFYSTGARVIVFDTKGKFQLARFSTAVSKYYVVPPASDLHIDAYIEAIKRIVHEEEVEYFIPVSETGAAYYDGLVKTHLELVGCVCVCPNVDDVLLLDDVAEMLRQADRVGLPIPTYYSVTSYQELNRLYDLGPVKREPHMMISCGPTGCKSRVKFELPASRRDFRVIHPINESHPWIVVPKCAAENYVTCTMVRNSQIVCNVTCISDMDKLVPVEQPEIDQWLARFFASLKPERNVVGHFSFHFIRNAENGAIVPVDSQVGVRLPYICYTSAQARIVCKPCRHFIRSKSGPLVNRGGKYWLHGILIEALMHMSPVGVWNLLSTVFGRNDALFVLWDPLPYCAYYYLQLPFYKFVDIVKKYAEMPH